MRATAETAPAAPHCEERAVARALQEEHVQFVGASVLNASATVD